MAKVFGYVRVSTETQAEKGYGLQAQESEIRKYAASHGLELAEIFRDEGISGNLKDTDEDEAINKREAFMELLSILEDGDTIIVLNTSRLWRSDMTRAIIKRELMKKSAKVISIEQPRFDLYSKDPGDYLINAIMEALDVYERMNISLKLARGRTVKAKGGDKPAGIAPFGYKWQGKEVVIDENEAATVKLIFSELQKGKSLHKVADYLNAQGLKTRRGKQWSAGNVQVIGRNKFYVGILQHQGKEIQGNHTPIISRVQFGKVAAQLTKRKKG